MTKGKQNKFKFRRNDRIGAAGAEEDAEFLEHCFVDTGVLSLLENLEDNRIILLGRTGAGKTASLQHLKTSRPDRVISIEPEHLALTYVANSTVLNFFASIGVNLDPFFSLLWRHVLTVEILSHHFEHHVPERSSQGLLQWLRSKFSGESRPEREMTQVIAYLEEWGKSFWQETELRVKEITRKVESELNDQVQAGVSGKLAKLDLSKQAIERLTDGERAELVSRGQDIVSKAQVRDLHKVIPLLGEVLADRQKQYFVVVDRLDENWVEERLRYKLIMALILTARDFIKVGNAKVVLALRRDLVDRVFRLTRDSGFQEEKYQSLYLPLTWTKDEILDILDSRVNYMVSRRYTKQAVGHRDLLPGKYDDMAIGDYIYSIARRPRDVIAWFNTCIDHATDQAKITATTLGVVEGDYSRSRLRALADEWSADYPHLLDFTKILNRRSSSFKLGTVTDDEINDLCLNIVAVHPEGRGILIDQARALVDGIGSAEEVRLTLLQVFYRTGLVGLKVEPHEPPSWVYDLGQAVSRSQLSDETSVVVSPAFARALGVGGK